MCQNVLKRNLDFKTLREGSKTLMAVLSILECQNLYISTVLYRLLSNFSLKHVSIGLLLIVESEK